MDTWCIGVLTYVMITGKYPYRLDEKFENKIDYENFHNENLLELKIPN